MELPWRFGQPYWLDQRSVATTELIELFFPNTDNLPKSFAERKPINHFSEAPSAPCHFASEMHRPKLLSSSYPRLAFQSNRYPGYSPEIVFSDGRRLQRQTMRTENGLPRTNSPPNLAAHCCRERISMHSPLKALLKPDRGFN